MLLEHLQAFREEARFSTWLMRIATHAALKIIRKRKGLPTVSLEEMTRPDPEDETIPHPEFIADWRQSPETLVHSREIRRLLEEALDLLDEKHRLVFLLRDVEGLSIAETAQALGLSEANVKVRPLRARLQLREHLTRFTDLTFFDLLVMAASCEDCEPRLLVDVEELENLAARHLEGARAP